MAETKSKVEKILKVDEAITEPVEVDVVKISAENPGSVLPSPQENSQKLPDPVRYSGPQTSESNSRSVPTDAVNAEITLKTENQRQINLIWESTQQKIAFFAIGIAVLVAAALCFVGNDQGNKTAAFVFLTGQASLITGFYFGRTNHQRTGGVGGSNEQSR